MTIKAFKKGFAIILSTALSIYDIKIRGISILLKFYSNISFLLISTTRISKVGTEFSSST